MIKRTALYDEHVRQNGRMVEFGGWEMPIQYSGIIEEHLACRSAAGLFDVSHMGEFHLEGPDSETFLNALVTNDVSKLQVGQAQYTAMCNRDGGIVDDLVIYRRGPLKFLLVVNAANIEKDFKHAQAVLAAYKDGKVEASLTNHSSEYSQIAIQGPKAEAILQALTSIDLSHIQTYWFQETTVLDEIQAIVARTGYTGEDGFEVYVPWEAGPAVWNALLEAGRDHGIRPCGLGARDTLRLEMKYPLYGNELTDETLPLEAGLGWVTKLGKGDFVGREPNLKAKEAGIRRKLVGIQLTDRGIPRQGYTVHTADGDRQIGQVTSGTQSPSLKIPIGIAYIESEHAAIGQEVTVDIRGKKLKARIVKTPFYHRPY